MGVAQQRSILGVGERTARDARRRRERIEADLHWAEVDRDIAAALGEDYPGPSTQEAHDG